MLGFFKSPQFVDPALGQFVRSRGHWRGTMQLDGEAVRLILIGGRSEPNAEALVLARTIATDFVAWRPSIEAALFAHYQPHAEMLADGELPVSEEPMPSIGTPSAVWSHVSLVFVAVTPMSHVLVVELGFTTDWDVEHTLGARFQGGRFVELCGSVLCP